MSRFNESIARMTHTQRVATLAAASGIKSASIWLKGKAAAVEAAIAEGAEPDFDELVRLLEELEGQRAKLQHLLNPPTDPLIARLRAAAAMSAENAEL